MALLMLSVNAVLPIQGNARLFLDVAPGSMTFASVPSQKFLVTLTKP
jgi:hypothetical protein